MPIVLELKWMLVPFLACLVLSINHVYLGIHVIERKVIFVDLALAQIAALGATYAIALGYDPATDGFRISLFSLAFTFVGAGAFAIARMRRERVPQEAFIGIIYAAASAGAILILSKSATGGEELKHMLTGDVLLVSLKGVGEMALLYGSIGIFHVIFRKKFLAISMGPEQARAAGVNIHFWDMLFYMSFGVVITKSVAIVGVLLVFSYLVVPAVIAQMWSSTIRGRLLFGWLVAVLASMAGIVWSFYSDYPTGPAVVVMLAIFLIASSVTYYIRNAEFKLRATGNLVAIAVCAVLFFGVLSHFKKEAPAEVKLTPADMLLNELKEGEEAHQLDAIIHLAGIDDVRIVPALTDLLHRTKSEQVIEAAVEALGRQKDGRAIPALRDVVQHDYDDFLKFTIAQSQLALGDKEGFLTLLRILQRDEAGFARQQAADLFEETSGRKFGYDAQKTVAANRAALENMNNWWRKNQSQLKWDPRTGKFAEG
jgi:zinc/manganese transport system permease protein